MKSIFGFPVVEKDLNIKGEIVLGTLDAYIRKPYRPVLLLGNGIRNDKKLIERLTSLNIPVLLTWMACDFLAEDHPAYCGRPGILGMRAANIIQQKATHLYCFGARLDPEQVFYDYDCFAPNAEIYIYDVDEAEFQKFPPRYHTTTATAALIDPGPADWIAWCKALYARFRPELDGSIESNGKFVDPFGFIRLLGEYSHPDDVFAIGSSGNPATTFLQTFKVQAGQRVSNVCSIGCMGADVPMALGAAVAGHGKRVICVTGDGGFQMNTQELETIRRLHLPIIFFVFSNNGYASIRNNQDIRFNGHRVGCDPKSGLTLPSLEDTAIGYRLPYLKLTSLANFEKCFTFAPLIVEVMVDPNWAQYPRVMATKIDGQFYRDSMEQMTPYLPEEELKEIMEW